MVIRKTKIFGFMHMVETIIIPRQCNKNDIDKRNHFMEKCIGNSNLPKIQNYNLVSTLMEDMKQNEDQFLNFNFFFRNQKLTAAKITEIRSISYDPR